MTLEPFEIETLRKKGKLKSVAKPIIPETFPPRMAVTFQHLTAHLYANPTHEVNVSNSGMPAEMIRAECDNCSWYGEF